jgi:hypothetical protein
MNACAASVRGGVVEYGDDIDKCKVTAEVHAYPANVFDLEIQLQELQPNGHFVGVPGSILKKVFYDAFDGSGNPLSHDWSCIPGRVFLGWVWGRFWHGYHGATIWSGSRVSLHSATCEGSPPNVDGGDAPEDGDDE